MGIARAELAQSMCVEIRFEKAIGFMVFMVVQTLKQISHSGCGPWLDGFGSFGDHPF